MLNELSHSLYSARNSFLWFVPYPAELLTLKWRKVYYILNNILRFTKTAQCVNNTGWSDTIGKVIGHEIISRIRRPIKNIIKKNY